jgi:hypothetical protein
MASKEEDSSDDEGEKLRQFKVNRPVQTPLTSL